MKRGSELTRILNYANEERCLLRNRWEEGASLNGKEQLRLAKALAAIKPARIKKGGRTIPCEARFELRPKDRRRVTEALLMDGLPDGEILFIVPRLTQRTFDRIKADLGLDKKTARRRIAERRFQTKRTEAVGRPWMAYLDATSGADREAERCFHATVRGQR